MEKIILKIKKTMMKHKKWMIAVAVIVGIFVFAGVWSWSLEAAADHVVAINTLFAGDLLKKQEKTEEVDDGHREIQYTLEGAYLVDSRGEALCGPYKMIYEDSYSEYCRFLGANGRMGYLSKTDGKVVIPPKFIRATSMYEGPALVSECADEGIYYISETGERLTRNYSDGYPFSESQGQFARVKLPDGTWGIINRRDEILANFEFMNPLPCVYTIGSAINNNGNAVLYQLPAEGSEEFKEIQELPQFCEISEVYMGEFAKVKNREGYYGVIHWNGAILLEDKYKAIDWEVLDIDENIGSDVWMFIVQEKDNTYDTVMWKD